MKRKIVAVVALVVILFSIWFVIQVPDKADLFRAMWALFSLGFGQRF